MYKRILIVVDTKPAARAAVLEGTALAKVHGAEVLFFTVLPNYIVPVADMPMLAVVSPEQFEREARNSASRILAAATVIADKAGVLSRTASAAGDDPAHVIAAAARRRKCDVIVAASEGRNAVLRLLTGSVIPGLITAATVPVLVCKPKPASRPDARAAASPRKTRTERRTAASAARTRRTRASA